MSFVNRLIGFFTGFRSAKAGFSCNISWELVPYQFSLDWYVKGEALHHEVQS
jgi:hypothetical protein